VIIDTYRNRRLLHYQLDSAAQQRAELRRREYRAEREHQIVCGVLWGLAFGGFVLTALILSGLVRWPN